MYIESNIQNNEPINLPSEYIDKMVKITHNAGFFSCCSVKLWCIVDYINLNKSMPLAIDSSAQFEWYKENKMDITYEYFQHYDNINNDIKTTNFINYHHDDQYENFSKLDYTNIIPIVKKYFSPSTHIQHIIETMEQKYNLDYDNLCVLFYRGNDKIRETTLCKYDEYVVHINSIIAKKPNIKFLIQSDETEFIEYMTKKFPNSFYFKDEIRHIKKCNNTVDILLRENIFMFSKYYLAITYIMSKCKYIICGTGNCSIWIMFFRGNCNHVYQHKDNNFLVHNPE